MARKKPGKTYSFHQLEFSFDESPSAQQSSGGVCALPTRKLLYEYSAGPVRGLIFRDLTDNGKEPTISLSRVFTDTGGKAYESNHFNAEDQRLIEHVFAVCREWLDHTKFTTEHTESTK